MYTNICIYVYYTYYIYMCVNTCRYMEIHVDICKYM